MNDVDQIFLVILGIFVGVSALLFLLTVLDPNTERSSSRRTKRPKS